MAHSKPSKRQSKGPGTSHIGGQPVRGITTASGPGGNAASPQSMTRKKLPGNKSAGLTKSGR